MQIADLILREIVERLSFLDKVGLDYLTLSRAAGRCQAEKPSVSGLRRRSAPFVRRPVHFDEPSIGLHQRDNDRLISALKT